MWLEDLQAHLDAQRFVDEGAVVIGPLEDDASLPDLAIAIVSRQGPVTETFTEIYGRPNVSIVVRSEPMKQGPAMDKAMDVFMHLASMSNVVLGSTLFQRFQPMAWPDRLGMDQQRRIDVVGEISVWLGENAGRVPSTP